MWWTTRLSRWTMDRQRILCCLKLHLHGAMDSGVARASPILDRKYSRRTLRTMDTPLMEESKSTPNTSQVTTLKYSPARLANNLSRLTEPCKSQWHLQDKPSSKQWHRAMLSSVLPSARRLHKMFTRSRAGRSLTKTWWRVNIIYHSRSPCKLDSSWCHPRAPQSCSFLRTLAVPMSSLRWIWQRD